ncbi:MAG: sulfotransferase family protein, partial [Alphaproteobacteria bacterium]|nr:sulfotransferase family protein [Alphaproteobacteria bacterium]
MLDIPSIQHLSKQGQHQEAIAAASKLLKANRDSIPVKTCLGFVLINGGEFSKALKIYRDLLKSAPLNIDYLFGAAICHAQLRQFTDAENAYQRLINLKPNEFKYKMNYGVLLREHGFFDQSEAMLRQAQDNNPHYAEIYHNLAITLEQLERFDEALAIYDQALERDPKHYRALSNQGSVYTKLNQLEAAEGKFKACLAINPHYLNGLNNLGLVYLYQRQTDAAKAMFQDAIAKHPHDGKAYFNLSNLDDLTDDDLRAVIAQLEEQINTQALTHFLDKGLFALAQFYQKQKNTAKSEAYYLKGNRHVARQRPYDNHKTQQQFDLWRRFSTSQPKTAHDTANQKIIFIIGMPRSGTTLLESMLASCDAIAAGDELPYLNDQLDKAVARLNSKSPVMTTDEIKAIAQHYKDKTQWMHNDDQWLIDKLPHNFKWAPLIADIFPKAKILHCHRDPMDNCWSLYRVNFEQGHAYCFDRKALGQYYAHYQNLMKSYNKMIGDRMLSVSYDELVKNPNDESQRIFDYIGLEGYHFDEAKRGQNYFSRTASS